MNTFISMLRGINVSGQKKIRMAELKAAYEELGLVRVQTYLQSGNVVFASAEPEATKLAKLIEDQIERSFGYAVSVFIRDGHDFGRIIADNELAKGDPVDPTKLLVTFLYRSPDQARLANLAAPAGVSDQFLLGRQEIMLFCPNGYGRSKLSNAFFERKLQVPATTRNWKTVQALYSLANEEW